MIRAIVALTILVLLSACSFKQPPNAWQIKSISAFEKYQYHFLSNRKVHAENSYKKAVQQAKLSAQLETLSRVYLGKCALNIAVLVEDNCTEFKNRACKPNCVNAHSLKFPEKENHYEQHRPRKTQSHGR